MSQYVITINSSNIEEEFEKEGNNVCRVSVLNKDGKDISNQCRVQIELSKNALLGLGTELIRLAHHFQDSKHTHLHPVDKNLVSQNMGIYLTTDSCELIIATKEFDIIDKYVK